MHLRFAATVAVLGLIATPLAAPAEPVAEPAPVADSLAAAPGAGAAPARNDSSGAERSGRSFTLRVDAPTGADSAVVRRLALVARTLQVPLHPGQPPYQIRVVPDVRGSSSPGVLHHVGSVSLYRPGSKPPIQRLDLESRADATLFAPNCHVVDVNFDGHADLVTLAEVGPAWGRHDFRMFDPQQDRFVQTALGLDLGKLRVSELGFDAATRTIRASYPQPGVGLVGETYAIRNGRLVRTAVTERRADGHGGFKTVTRTVQPKS